MVLNKNKYKIVLLTVWRVLNGKGGTEKVFCDMANELSRRGYSVTAIIHDDSQQSSSKIFRDEVKVFNCYKESGFLRGRIAKKIRCFSLSRKIRKNRRFVFSLGTLAKNIEDVSKICDLDFDVAISFQPEATYILKEILGIAKPVVTMYHFSPKVLEENIYSEILKDGVAKSEVLQVLMPEYQNYLRKRYPNSKVVRIPNVAPQYEWSSNLTEKKIINVARLADQKRALLLLEAMRLVNKDFPDWVCEWWGETHVEPEYTDKVKKLIRDYGLEGSFILCGATDDIVGKLKKSSIFAFPSSYEGQSLSLLEAMAAGMAVVGCRDCLSVNSMIEDGKTGILTAPTPESLYRGIAMLISDFNLRKKLGSNAKKEATVYSSDRVWGSWEALIGETVIQFRKNQ